MARTQAEVEEEYTAARNAYLKALKAESYSVEGVSLSRPNIKALRDEMDRLAEEMARFTNGGITVTAITPV